MDKDRAWQVIHQERAALADLLETLTPKEWARASLCAGWSVRDVAAHVISAPEATVGQAAAAVIRAKGSFDRANYDYAQRLAARPEEAIVADYRRLATSRRRAPGTTYRDALVDVLVHTQDIAIPLGRRHEMPRDAARASATAFARRSFPFKARKRLAGFRLQATDIDWSSGQGPLLQGPIAALLLLITGRPAALTWLEGDGLLLLRQEGELTS